MAVQPRPDRPSSWQARLPFFYGWLIVGLGFFGAFFGIGLVWAASILAVPMRDELGWSNAAFFFALSLRGWTGIFITPLIGPYIDRLHGLRILVLVGALINVGSLLLISRVNAEWQFILLFGVVGGVAQACQAGMTVIIPKWFIRQRGLAVSLSTMGGGLSALVLPPLLIGLDGALGWRSSWLVIALLAFVFSALPVLLLRRQPEDIGLLPDGDDAPVEGSGSVQRQEEVSFTRRDAVRTRTFWILVVGISIGSLAANGIPANITNMFVERGLEFDLAATALVAYGIGSMSAKVAWGWLANRLHLRKVLLLLTAYGMVALPSILLIPSSVGSPALGYGFLVGFYVGAFTGLNSLVWATYFGRRNVGAISGIGRPFSAAFLSGGPFMMAFTRDLFGTYTVGILVSAAAVAVAFAGMYMVRPPQPPSDKTASADASSAVAGG